MAVESEDTRIRDMIKAYDRRRTAYERRITGKEFTLEKLAELVRKAETIPGYVGPTIDFLSSVSEFLEVDGTARTPGGNRGQILFKPSRKFPDVSVYSPLPFFDVGGGPREGEVRSSYMSVENETDLAEFSKIARRYRLEPSSHCFDGRVEPIGGLLLVPIIILSRKVKGETPDWSIGTNYSVERHYFSGILPSPYLHTDPPSVLEGYGEAVCDGIAAVQPACADYAAYKKDNPNTAWLPGIPVVRQRDVMITEVTRGKPVLRLDQE